MAAAPAAKVTTETLRQHKARGEKITVLTCYDALFAALLDRAGLDVLLVGDSVATVLQGVDTTIGVTMDQMVYHCTMVRRGCQRALVVGDMPFLSYQVSSEDALRNAGRLLQEGGAEAVKLEGGAAVAPTVARLTAAGIPVLGHLGLTPQSIHRFGTYRVRGTDPEESARILADAQALEQAGACALVLEKVPAALARDVTRRLRIPTIGIGAGPHCDGQVLVTPDLLGLYTRFKPRFVRRYAELEQAVLEAAARYCADVRAGSFPGSDESY
jgi:3-methyl-2-oxobutanoate hydroxymethyltransferase